MNNNLAIMVLKYGNKHHFEHFKGRTPYIESSNSDDNVSNEGTPNDKKVTPNSKKGKNNTNTDFSTAFAEASNSNKKVLTKKNTHMAINFDSVENEDTTPKLPPIYVTPENENELVYSDLL